MRKQATPFTFSWVWGGTSTPSTLRTHSKFKAGPQLTHKHLQVLVLLPSQHTISLGHLRKLVSMCLFYITESRGPGSQTRDSNPCPLPPKSHVVPYTFREVSKWTESKTSSPERFHWTRRAHEHGCADALGWSDSWANVNMTLPTTKLCSEVDLRGGLCKGCTVQAPATYHQTSQDWIFRSEGKLEFLIVSRTVELLTLQFHL